jgi:predicted dithiol-disulfide oxidoreductase (DUF899 family)
MQSRCTCEVDPVESVLVHVQNHDVNDTVVPRAPVEEIAAVRKSIAGRFT